METIYEIETVKIALRVAEPQKRKVDSSAAAIGVLRSIYADLDVDQEHFCLLSLDNKNHMRGYKVLFSGGVNQCHIDQIVLFRTALLLGATRIVVAHNHPTGDPEPSPQDHQLTESIARSAALLNLSFVDHIILGGSQFFQFARKGFLSMPLSSAGQSCYHRFNEEILEEIKKLLPLADPVTARRIERLLRDRGATPADWERLKLSKKEELRVKKEHVLAEFIAKLREAEDNDALEALTARLEPTPPASGGSGN